MKRFLIVVALAVGFAWACDNKKDHADSVNHGTINIAADESMKRVVDALVEIYHRRYPRTHINIKYMPENEGITAMLRDSVRLVFASRKLVDLEKEALKKDNFTEKPAILALEGVAIIANKSSGLKSLSLEKLKEILDGKTKYQVGFDHSNSANLNFLVDKFQIKDITKSKVSAANGTEDLINFVSKDPLTIGVIGMSWVSDQHSKIADGIKKKVQILSISKTEKDIPYPPTAYSIDQRKYPLERLIYIHIKESYWGLGSGFQRFACGQVGQLIVEKEGLQPYYLFAKQLNIKKEALPE